MRSAITVDNGFVAASASCDMRLRQRLAPRMR